MFVGQINLEYLRNQQNTLGVLNASRIFLKSQYKLRKILKHQTTDIDQSQEQYSIEEDLNQHPILMIQKLLIKATQPSPLKPGYTLQEMQLASLNLSQYLAAEVNLEQPNTSGVTNCMKPNIRISLKDDKSELPTPNSECSVKSVVSEKTYNKKKKNEESGQVHISPLVTQIMEMGFTRRSVENALKSLGIFHSNEHYFCIIFM